jgi:arylsulfatase A-like enzyme
MTPGRSLLLITVDCLRADHVGFLGYKRPTTPYLDSLATDSVVFSNAIVAGAPTYYSFPAILAARHPLALGRDVIGLAPDEKTLAAVLRDAGYSTGAFLAGNPYLSPRFGYDSGFETFRDHLDEEIDPASNGAKPSGSRSGWGQLNRRLAGMAHKASPLSSIYEELYFQYCQRIASSPAQSLDRLRRFPAADVMVDEACAWLAQAGDKPFFLWLHLMDPHSPYYPPAKALEQMEESKIDASRARYLNSYWNRGDLGPERLKKHREAVVALYDAGIRWVDSQVARLVDRLRDLKLWDGCVMALTADHGEEFLDHGGRYHPPSKVTEELIRVPLLVRSPEVRRSERVGSPFSLVNLAPTLLDVLNAPRPGGFRGTGYWSKLKKGINRDEAALVECVAGCNNPFQVDARLSRRILAVREARYKLVLDFASATEQVFDLEADPGERRPLPEGAEKPVRKRLLERARDHIHESVQSRDPELRLGARLRDLRLEWAHSAPRVSA